MKSSPGKSTIGFACLLLASSQLYASGVGWLGDAPIRYFSEQDNEMMKAAVQQALNNHADGEVLEWKNPETGHNGSVTPMDKKTVQGLSCRKARLFNNAGGRTAKSVFTFCRHTDGQWKLANK